jgi:hypothetical protein
VISGKYNKTSDRNKHYKGKGTGKKPKDTHKMYTRDDRISIGIPKKSDTYKYLHVFRKGEAIANWEKLDLLVKIAETERQNYAIRLFDDFLKNIAYYYPDKKADINMLRPLIIRHILKGETLDNEYYKMLRDL